jgi:hypothetical protein
VLYPVVGRHEMHSLWKGAFALALMASLAGPADAWRSTGSGKPPFKNTTYKNRSTAKEAATRAGKGNPIAHAGHFHPVDGKGNKKPGRHYRFTIR